jgi:hypothetical protein
MILYDDFINRINSLYRYFDVTNEFLESFNLVNVYDYYSSYESGLFRVHSAFLENILSMLSYNYINKYSLIKYHYTFLENEALIENEYIFNAYTFLEPKLNLKYINLQFSESIYKTIDDSNNIDIYLGKDNYIKINLQDIISYNIETNIIDIIDKHIYYKAILDINVLRGDYNDYFKEINIYLNKPSMKLETIISKYIHIKFLEQLTYKPYDVHWLMHSISSNIKPIIVSQIKFIMNLYYYSIKVNRIYDDNIHLVTNDRPILTSYNVLSINSYEQYTIFYNKYEHANNIISNFLNKIRLDK